MTRFGISTNATMKTETSEASSVRGKIADQYVLSSFRVSGAIYYWPGGLDSVAQRETGGNGGRQEIRIEERIYR